MAQVAQAYPQNKQRHYRNAFPDWTPYRYGFNNPIRYTDPTGMYESDFDDEYMLSERGKLIFLRETNDPYDVIYNSDLTECIEVDKCFISGAQNFKYYGDNTIYEASNPEETENIFKFFARNTYVEFHAQIYQIGDKKRGFISTSNSSESGGYGFLKNKREILDKIPNSKLLKDIHSQPDFMTLPDGTTRYADYPSGFNPNGTLTKYVEGDWAYRNSYEQNPNYSGRIPSSFEIYVPKPNILVKYDTKSFSRINLNKK